jgi:hypothetical protein
LNWLAFLYLKFFMPSVFNNQPTLESEEESGAGRELRQEQHKGRILRGAGTGAKVGGAAMDLGGKGVEVAGKGMQAAGKGMRTGGGAMMRAGAALSGTGVGAIAGVPLAIAGGATAVAGAGAEIAGKGAEAGGKGLSAAGKGVKRAGSGLSIAGQLRQGKLADSLIKKALPPQAKAAAKIAEKFGIDIIRIFKRAIIFSFVFQYLFIIGFAILLAGFVFVATETILEDPWGTFKTLTSNLYDYFFK